ncbi:hypothetical protein GCM10008018_55770 [Paenibacillus marchantiophytorum]|uniref:Calcineurin-like phosphoesterase domain-containing protein n=1 Tax=Paenibacillus marchantiophytorum TaxID=1619310 RepID=A0ABQ1F917_9BACL|nr:metallophosphoesterase [Paenibacillus marchantiophytorum]GGA02506.1 hypothetical protein GCM10008018_55770 [Paenibacillus marchantiophytorum]
MKIAMIGDLHYPSMVLNRPEVVKARDAFFDYVLSAFLETEADYHIAIGDVANAGELVEFDYIFSKVESCGNRVRFIHIMGNHDTYTHDKAAILAATGLKPYERIETEQATLIMLDTARETVTDWSGFMEEEQLTWLEANLSEPSDKPLLVFAHHPIHGTTARSTEAMMSLHEAVQLRRILNKHTGVGFYFNGHNHVNSIVREQDWYFVQTAAMLDIPAIRLITVEDGQVSVELIKFDDRNVKEWAHIVSRHMPYFEPFPAAEGDALSSSVSARKGSSFGGHQG